MDMTRVHPAAPAAKKRIYEHLYFQVLCGMVFGILLGYFYPQAGGAMKPLGDAFIKLIRMIIAPIIFCTVVHGIASMSDLKKVGRVALKALIYFEAVTSLALLVSLLIVNVWQPGVGMNIDPSAIDTKPIQAYTTKVGQENSVDFLLHIIPGTVVGAFAEGEILQVLFFSVLFGFALSFLGERGKPVLHIIEVISHTFFRIVGIIMKAAPLGAFGAIAFTVGTYGIGTLLSLGKLVGGFYFTCPVHCEVGHRPPDRDPPFWIGCGAVLEPGKAHEAARFHHASRRCGSRVPNGCPRAAAGNAGDRVCRRRFA
jgi:aerobic C4-dicarboxylate transport protein